MSTAEGRQKETEDLLTRGQAAKAIGISVYELKRRQLAGQIGVVHSGGMALYRREAVEAMALERAKKKGDAISERQLREKMKGINPVKPREKKTKPSSGIDPKLASDVFKALADGSTAVQCVIQLNVPPDWMAYLTEAYAELSNVLLVDGNTMKEINRLPLDGPMPITKGEELLEVLKHYAEETSCVECNKRPKQLCKTCVNTAIKQVRSEKDGI